MPRAEREEEKHAFEPLPPIRGQPESAPPINTEVSAGQVAPRLPNVPPMQNEGEFGLWSFVLFLMYRAN